MVSTNSKEKNEGDVEATRIFLVLVLPAKILVEVQHE